MGCQEEGPAEKQLEHDVTATIVFIILSMLLIKTHLCPSFNLFMTTVHQTTGNGHTTKYILNCLCKFMNDFIKLNAGEKCLGLLYMGNYDKSPEVWQRTPIEEKTQWF